MGGSLRDAIINIAPRWLRNTVGAKLLYLHGLASDLLLEKLNQAMKMHIPTYGDPTGLPYAGLDRVMPQGPSEAPAAYAVRLKTANDDWQIAGSARSVLRQLRGYVSPSTPAVRTVGQSNLLTTLWDYFQSTDNISLPQTHYRSTNSNWNWDGVAGWWRTWAIIDCSGTNPPFTSPKWGDGHKWGDGTSWGFSGTLANVSAMQAIVSLWKPANITVVNIILSYDSTLFQPYNTTASGKNPNGTWGTYYTLSSGTAVPSRSWSAAYLPGVT